MSFKNWIVAIWLIEKRNHLILTSGLHRVAARTNIDTPAPPARIISRVSVVGAWKEAREPIINSLRKPKTHLFWIKDNIPGIPNKIGLNHVAANASYPDMSSSFSG